MNKFIPILFAILLGTYMLNAQKKKRIYLDDSLNVFPYEIELDPIILDNKIDVSDLIARLKADTTFYKSFKNLNVLNYTAIVSGKMLNKKNDILASIKSIIEQQQIDSCAVKTIKNQNIVGRIKNKKGKWNFYTCDIFGNLFLEESTKCNPTNIIGDPSKFNIQKSKGVSKRVEQIKMLVFNPGKKIPNFFYFGNKVALFDDNISRNYNYTIDIINFRTKECILFRIKAKEDLGIFSRADIVIDELSTWLDIQTWEIVGKKYTFSYNLGIVNFLISMEVEVSKYKDYLHPSVIRYSGKWQVPFYKTENGLFNVFLYNFSDSTSQTK